MISEGEYSVWFKTPIGEGAGVVHLDPDGAITGGDATFNYAGNWSQTREHFKAEFCAERFAAGPPGVFGMDKIDIVVSGLSNNGTTASCIGFAKQSPGLKLEVTLIRMGGD